MMTRAARTAIRRSLQAHGGLYTAAATAEMFVRYVIRRPHDEDFTVFRGLTSPVLFADVGANRGQSALSVAAVCRVRHRIVSFEPNPENLPHLRWVRRVLGDRFTYFPYGIGSEPAALPFYVPVRGSHRVTGEGSFDRMNVLRASDRLGGGYDVDTLALTVRTFDSFELTPDVVKLDIQGFELDALRGMTATLQRAQPLLLIEANDAHDDDILAHLHGMNYTRYRRDPAWSRLVVSEGEQRAANWFFATPVTRRRFPQLFDRP